MAFDKEQKEFLQAILYSSMQLSNMAQVEENITKYEALSDEEKRGSFAQYGYKLCQDRRAELLKLGNPIPAKYKEYEIKVYENLKNGMYQVEDNHKYGYTKADSHFPDNVPKYITKGEVKLL